MSFSIHVEKKPPIYPYVSDSKYDSMDRSSAAMWIRSDAAVNNYQSYHTPQQKNGDETLYPNKIASFTKCLMHDGLGQVNLNSFATLTKALKSRNPDDFEEIKLQSGRKLVNPQAGLSYDLEGWDSNASVMTPPPTFSSDEMSGEIIENYWMALCRDVSFLDYETDPIVSAAVADLNNRRVFFGPKVNNLVTIGTLFRGVTQGELIGPYISQFFYLPIPFGPSQIDAKMKTYMPNTNFMTNYVDWLAIQNGSNPTETPTYDPVLRYIRNGRDLSQWVHMDVLYEAYFNAMLILMTAPSESSQNTGIGCPLNPTNPYINSSTQEGFATFGGPHIATLLTEVANRALKHTWYQKWFVHLKLRPEAFGGAIHLNKTGSTNFPISSDLQTSTVFQRIFDLYGTYLLPIAFTEGSPVHPSYPAGHATVAGACITILKAFFDENYVIPNPKVPSADGLSLVNYSGTSLTVGHELNKICSNVSIGRNHAGVHYRSDATESQTLGETLAISVLRDQKFIYNEKFSGWRFTKFDGTICVV